MKTLKHYATIVGVIALLTLGFVSCESKADEYQLGVSYARINQNLFGKISFPMEGILVNGGYWSDNTDWGKLGIKLSYGKSTTSVDKNANNALVYKNRINSLFSGEIVYGYEITDTSTIYVGVGKTDYKSTWWVNGEIPEWGLNGSDSDWSYSVGWEAEINPWLTYTLGYKDLYRKHKEGYGKEHTTMWHSGFTIVF